MQAEELQTAKQSAPTRAEGIADDGSVFRYSYSPPRYVLSSSIFLSHFYGEFL